MKCVFDKRRVVGVCHVSPGAAEGLPQSFSVCFLILIGKFTLVTQDLDHGFLRNLKIILCFLHVFTFKQVQNSFL